MSTRNLKQPDHWDMLDRLYFNKDITFIRRPRLPLTTIAVECAAAWGIPITELKGRIIHASGLDKTLKYSFLFAVYLFSDTEAQEVETHFGYGRALHTAGQWVLYEGRTGRKHAKVLQSFFSNLFTLCPEAYEQWR